MRGIERTSGSLFSYVDLEARVPARHPLRAMRDLVNGTLAALDGAFQPLYSLAGRPSIPPGQVLRATLLQLLYTIRSERQLMERMEYDLLFRWFVGLGIDDPVFVPTVFAQRQRLEDGQGAQDRRAAGGRREQIGRASCRERVCYPV